ncbi:F-actin-uncapping protein LRRC16A-like [Triplophysa rosa]|uniref:F-actin-uncapping protein LRRC16A-like n=1 Tax=Triplophysa rosa TaxID=992332 RepID=UPI0025460D73|nr:F-actin-uncapping protein LRRC16A-like [Triplophysa rosa]
MSGDVPRDLMESVQEAVGQQVKLCVIKRVNLEVKGDRFEGRILVCAMKLRDAAILNIWVKDGKSCVMLFVFRDLVAIVAALEFSQWFIKLSIKDVKLTADLCEQILKVVSRSTKLEELTLDNTGLKSDFAVRFAGALSLNPSSALHTISFANNCLEDKGVVVLSSALSKLTAGLKQLDLSKNSLSTKGEHTHMSGLLSLWGQSIGVMFLYCTNCIFYPLSLTLSLNLKIIEHSWSSVCVVCDVVVLCCVVLCCVVLCCRKVKECSSSLKQFFSSALSLHTVCLSATKLPTEALKAVLLGLASNRHLRDVSLDISSCELRSAGSQILEGCIADITNISSLDISDNGLDSDLSTLLVWIGKNRSIKHLSIGRNFSNIRTKNLGQVLVSLIHMIQEEESPLMSLSLADSRLKVDLSVVLNAVGGSSLIHLDISGNSMGDIGAKMLAKALQINTKLRTVVWDRNGVSAQGLQDVAAALEKNYTIRFMPIPIIDAAQALKNSPEKTEDALLKMEQYLLRNHESRRYLQEQAFRLQQGIVTSTTQQLIGQVCVQVQDQLNSLRFSKSDRVQQDMKTAEKLLRDAKSSGTLLWSVYHLRSGGCVVDSSAGVCVQQVQEKLCAVAAEISALIQQQLQSLFVSMLDTAESVCPHVMQKSGLRDDVLSNSKERMSVPQDFITSTLLEQSAIDIINKISEVKFSMASCLSDNITDEILQSLSHSQHTLAGHLSCREKPPLMHQTSQDRNVLDVRQIHDTQIHENQTLPQTQTHEVKRRTVYSRMFRPVSAAFNLEFDLSKALEEVSMHVDDLPPPPLMSPPPVEEGLHLPQLECFSDLPTVDTPALQHVTKTRPRRTKRAKASRATPISRAAAQEVDQGGSVHPLDEGVPEFFFKKVINIGAKVFGSDVEGTSPLIKRHSSTKTTPTSPTFSTTTTATISISTAEKNVTPPEPIVTAGDPCIPAVPEVKGHVQEGVKREGQLIRGHVGVQVLGGDMLMEIRAKQEKRKKAGVSPSVEPKAEHHTDAGENHERTTAEIQKEPRAQHTRTPAQARSRPLSCSSEAVWISSSGCLSQESITPPPLDDITYISTGDSSPALVAPPLCQWGLQSDTEWVELSPVTHGTKGGDSSDTSSVVVLETDTHTNTKAVVRSVSCVHSRTDPDEDTADRQRTKSLPSADGLFSTSDSAAASGFTSDNHNTDSHTSS